MKTELEEIERKELLSACKVYWGGDPLFDGIRAKLEAADGEATYANAIIIGGPRHGQNACHPRYAVRIMEPVWGEPDRVYHAFQDDNGQWFHLLP